jgi:transcriptional regulator with XRE-family HTH domain
MTQQQLADRMKRPQSFVAKVEGGERRLDVVEFAEWTIALGADYSELLKPVVALAYSGHRQTPTTTEEG